MKHLKWLAPAAMVFVGGCEDEATAPSDQTFTATMNGANERPNPVTTPGVGTANFTLSADGNTLTWNVSMTGTNNVTAAHIHVGGAQVAGPIILGLFAGPTANNPTITGSVTRAAFASPLGVTRRNDCAHA